MNLRHVGYRAYQCVFGLGARLLPWRQPETITGPGSLADIPARLTRYGARRPLVVASRRQCADPAFQQMLSRLEGYTLFSDIQPNPPVSTVEAAAALYRQAHCDSLVAVGGGSPMDTAKAAAALVVRPGKAPEQLAGLLKVRRAIPPFIAVPTTAGTGSETTIAAVVTGADHHKYAINDLCLIPRCAVLDPLLTVSLPPHTTAETGMDALTHAVEAYISKDANPVTDAAAIQAIRLIARNLRQAVALGSNLKARENMAYASLLAGMAFNNANLGYVHAMAHQLGGLYDMPHGVANAVLLPHVARYNLIANPEKFADIAEFMGENTDGLSTMDAAELAIRAIARLSADIGIPQHLRELGVKEADFPYMAEMALKDGNAFSNPRKGNEKEIAGIFRQAF